MVAVMGVVGDSLSGLLIRGEGIKGVDYFKSFCMYGHRILRALCELW